MPLNGYTTALLRALPTCGLRFDTVEVDPGVFEFQADGEPDNATTVTELADDDFVLVYKDGVLGKLTLLNLRASLGLPYAVPFSFTGVLEAGMEVIIPVRSASPTIQIVQLVVTRAMVAGLSGYTVIRVADPGGISTPLALLFSATKGSTAVSLTLDADTNARVYVDSAAGGHADLQGYLILKNG